jgi:hypothetical protein
MRVGIPPGPTYPALHRTRETGGTCGLSMPSREKKKNEAKERLDTFYAMHARVKLWDI